MKILRVGQIFFALGLAALGVLSLGSGDFAVNWQPVPKDIPFRELLAYASGAMLVAGGLGVFFARTAKAAAILLALNVTLWLVALQVPRVSMFPGNLGVWLGFGETAVNVVGGWFLVRWISGRGANAAGASVVEQRTVRFLRCLFVVALVLIGLSHVAYPKETAALVPSWLPYRVGWAYLTGVFHIAAGVGVCFDRTARLAAALEGVMIALFAVLVWVPIVISKPEVRINWTAMLISFVIAGACWIVAGSLPE